MTSVRHSIVTGRQSVAVAAAAVIITVSLPRSAGAQSLVPRAPVTFSGLGARLLQGAVGRAGAMDSNTVLSPVSAGLALSLAWFGADGATAAALARAMGIGGTDRTTLAQRGADLLESLHERRDVQLDLATALWADTSITLNKSFLASAQLVGAKATAIPLSSARAMNTINKWAAGATHGKIATIINTPLPDTSALFIGNVVYFKAKWAHPFLKNQTRPHAFTLLSGRTTTVQAMERTGQMRYINNDGYRMVRLPYAGDRIAMYIILPDSGNGGKLESRFAENGWPVTLTERNNRTIHLVLPRVHAEQEIDLQPLVTRLGAGAAFDCRRANFNRMTATAADTPARPVCIGKALQKVYLDIDEEGTEAAAASGIGMVSPTAAHIPTDFIVDRPFLIVLRDEVTGANLFVGSIRNP